jgi:eukaryotic-like serine/threonine-protein kinase
MPDDRARRAHTIFTKALGLPRQERAAFVASACADDAGLLRDLQRLLAAADRSEGFLETPALAGTDQKPAPMPDAVGNYLVIGVLGSGGMATVYEAIQENPHRRVALKVMHQSVGNTEAAMRFKLECAALARLHHPGIAQIYEAGTAALGQAAASPFFAMELVPDALPITEYARTRGLSLHDRLAMFAGVCDAVLHGHQNGVIHRDIKAENVLVGPDGAAKVIDFGIARSTDASAPSVTRDSSTARLIGTLSAMSPEQCTAPEDIDVRTDVYSLGVLLYELVTDRKPYDLSRTTIPEAVRVICEHTPPAPSRFRGEARGDLDAIIGKAMEKERSRRYGGAGPLADDVRRSLADLPIEAKPATALDHARKFVRRNRGLSAAVAAAALALVTGIAVSSRLAYEAAKARDEAITRGRELETITMFQNSLLSDIDVRAMGEHLRTTITGDLERVSGASDAETDPVFGATSALLDRVNFTSIAVDSLDDAILSRYRAAVDLRFADQPLLRARLLLQLAGTMDRLGLHARAEPIVRDALGIRRATVGEDHADTLEAAYQLGALLSRLGRYDEALALLRETRERLLRTIGPEARESLRAGVSLGGVYRHMNDLEQAQRIWAETLEFQRRVLGNDNSDTMRTLSNLGIVHASQGRMREAERCWREVIERRGNSDGPEVRSARANLAVVLQEQGRYAEALPLLESTLATERRVRGDRHASTLTSMSQLAMLLDEMGELEASEKLQRECYEGRLSAFGTENADTLRSKGSLASLVRRTGDLLEAERLIAETVAGQRRVIGDEHPDTITSLVIAAEIARDRGVSGQARERCVEALGSARRVFARDPGMLGTLFATSGRVLLEIGEHVEGVAVLREAHELLASAFSPSHPHARDVAERLAAYFTDLHEREPEAGHDREAETWKVKAAAATTPDGAPAPSGTAAPR